jgi:DNA-directed RNA polymerase
MQTTSESLEPLFARQKEMEDHALALGGQRFRKKLEEAIAHGSEAQVGAAKKLLTEGLVKVEEALQALLDAPRGRGAQHAAIKWVKLLGADTASYLALKVVLDNIHGRVTVRSAAQQVTELIIDELRFRRFQQKEPQLFHYCMTSFSTSSYAHRARSLDARIHMAQVDISDLQMTQNERFVVGVKLLDIVREVTGLVTVESKSFREGGKNVDLVELVATPETLEWLAARNDALEFLWPVNLPMVMPPLPWAQGRAGGYRFALRGKHPMIRTNNKDHREMVLNAQMPQVYAALNRIQETPWRINTKVLEVIEAVLSRGGDIAGVPPTSDLPLPTKPPDMDREEVSKVWRRAASKVHDKNHEHRIARAELFRLLGIVNKVKDEGAIWFPHNLDFRGRVYPVTNYLHPQGDDICKALLQFAEGKELGREGAVYLALHGAASLGKTHAGAKLSHMTLQERVDYIVSITADILKVAEDPMASLWWADADDRWQFLAFCFDWSGYVAYDQEGRGEHYVSSLPVAMDGTCNGLQHFAALWLDPVGGKAVNVVPSDKPQDIYQAIANAVLDRLQVAPAGDEMAALWLRSGLVDRKLTKRPTMTFGYGSQQFGFAEQLKEYVQGLSDFAGKWKAFFSTEVADEETGELVPRSILHAASTYMAKLIWDSLESVAVSAFAGMAWMRSCAKVIAKDGGKCVHWVVPGTGFPVRQGYVEQNVQRARTILAGTAFRPAVYEATRAPAWKKQTSSVAPNIVHSLDAAALMLTVNQAADNGVQHFAMVHDSYGTLAADAGLLATCTRQAFHGLYTQTDVVTNLWMQFVTQVEGVAVEGEAVQLPVPPEKGANGDVMDISQVLLSDYFFS